MTKGKEYRGDGGTPVEDKISGLRRIIASLTGIRDL